MQLHIQSQHSKKNIGQLVKRIFNTLTEVGLAKDLLVTQDTDNLT